MTPEPDQRNDLDEAIHDLWEALAEANPLDRWLIVPATGVGVVVGLMSGMGLLTPLYAALLAGLAVALIWALRLVAKSRL